MSQRAIKNHRHLNECMTVLYLVAFLIAATTLKISHCMQTDCLANLQTLPAQLSTMGTISFTMILEDNHSLGHFHCQHKNFQTPMSQIHRFGCKCLELKTRTHNVASRLSPFQVSTSMCHQQRSDLKSVFNNPSPLLCRQ